MDPNKGHTKTVSYIKGTLYLFIVCFPLLGILFVCAAKIILKYGYEQKVFNFAFYKAKKDMLNKILNFNLNFSLFLGVVILLILFFYS